MTLREIARNQRGDDVLKLFGDLAHRVLSSDWKVFALQNQYQSLIEGQGEKCKLTTYSLLQPTIFEGFASTTIAGASFEDSMLYRLWTGDGVAMEPVDASLRKELRYDRHPNGHLITILYCVEPDWSKTLRDRMVEVDQQTIRLLDRIVAVLGETFGDEPFLWLGNNDLKDTLLNHKPGARRLPNSPHGLNEFQGYHNVVVLPALNPPPAHFSFMECRGISSEEMKTAHYRGAVYQAVMRGSARNPNDPTPKRFMVMDRATADWLADLFPGATVEPLPGMGCRTRKGKSGRPTMHESNAEKNRAYNERQKREWLAQLDLINGTSLVVGWYPFLAQEVETHMSEPEMRDETTVYEGHFVTRSLTSGTAFASIHDAIPLDYVDYTDDESFIAGLRALHRRVLTAKEDSGLFSPAHFDPDLAADTCRGLDNVRHLRGIWLDNDGGDLSHEEFVRLFPFLRVVIWNTYSSTPEKPRWRAFIPTSLAMSKDVHRIIMRQIEKVLNKTGYWSRKQLDENPRIKSRLTHGFDRSKFNAASLFYLPCQAKNPEDSFFVDHHDGKRAPLDLRQWVERCVLDVRPEAEPESQPAISPELSRGPVVSPEVVSLKLQAVRDKLVAEQAQSHAGRQKAFVDKAIENWRSTVRGEGHSSYFKLACALQSAGLSESEIKDVLHQEAAHAYSPCERRSEIRGILRSLQKRGRL